MEELKDAVRAVHAANKAMYDAGAGFVRAREAAIAKATAMGIKNRVVFMMGEVAWYLDPPKANKHPDGWEDGWTVSFGSRPEEIEVIE